MLNILALTEIFQLICDLIRKYVFSTVLNFLDFKFPLNIHSHFTFSIWLVWSMDWGWRGLLPLLESEIGWKEPLNIVGLNLSVFLPSIYDQYNNGNETIWADNLIMDAKTSRYQKGLTFFGWGVKWWECELPQSFCDHGESLTCWRKASSYGLMGWATAAFRLFWRASQERVGQGPCIGKSSELSWGRAWLWSQAAQSIVLIGSFT